MNKKKFITVLFICGIIIGILVPILLLPIQEPGSNVTIYTGDHTFSEDFVVAQDEKVIFKDGDLNFTGNTQLIVFGILEMYNVSFHGNLTAEGQVLLDEVTVNSNLIFTADSMVTIENSQINCSVNAYNFASVSIKNSTVGVLGSYMAAVIDVQESWGGRVELYGNSSIVLTDLNITQLITHDDIKVTCTYLTTSGTSEIYDNSSVVITNGSILYDVLVLGSLEMHNVIFQGNLAAEGQVLLDEVTVNSSLVFTGNSTATIQNSQIDCSINAYNFASVSINNSTVGVLGSYMAAVIDVQESSGDRVELYGNSSIILTDLNITQLITHDDIKATCTYLTTSGTSEIYDNSSVVITNGSILYDVLVLGSLEMHNVIFQGNLAAEGQVLLDEVTVNSSLVFTGNSTATIQNSQIDCSVNAYNFASVSINNSTVGVLGSYMAAIIDVQESSGGRVELYGNSSIVLTDLNITQLITHDDIKATCTYLTTSGLSEICDTSNVIITTGSNLNDLQARNYAKLNISYCNGRQLSLSRDAVVNILNFTASAALSMWQNCTVTIINSSFPSISWDQRFYSGNWTINNNSLSGVGVVEWVDVTIINTSYNAKVITLDVWNYANVTVTNSQYNWANVEQFASLTLINSTISSMLSLIDNSEAIIQNSTINYLVLSTNRTCYLENVTISNMLERRFQFFDGEFSGYNDTFSCMGTYAFTKLTMGPNVVYNQLRRSYSTWNYANLTLINTTCHSITCYDLSNLILVQSNITYMIQMWADSNVTLYGTDVLLIYLWNNNFAAILSASHVTTLTIQGTSNYTKSADSTIDNIFP